MAKHSLNHPDLNQEQLRDFTRLLNRNILHLHESHRVVIEEVFEVFKDSISPVSRRKILTLVNRLDDAIALSAKLRESLYEDLKYHIEREKRQKHEAGEDHKPEAEQQDPKS